jgi:hypothetical protein
MSGCAAADLWLIEEIVLPDGLGYATEVVDVDEAGRPDIIGSTTAGRHLIIEGKFWATLTDSQPVGYLRSLAEGGCLALITPEQRFPTIAAELVRRCVDAGLTVQSTQDAIEARFTRVEERWWMGVISWRALLGQIRAALLDAGDVGLAADVDQLDSLAELADTDAFLPLASADLSHPTPRRVYQYMQLVEAVIQHGSARGRIHTRGLRRGGVMGQYLRYAGAGTIQLALMMDLLKWSDLRHTPLWLKVWVDPEGVLGELERDQPPRVLLSAHDRNAFPDDVAAPRRARRGRRKCVRTDCGDPRSRPRLPSHGHNHRSQR